MDGNGYPRGIKGRKILKLSRIAAIADVFDALTTKRSYKDACNATQALQTMASMPKGKFDADIFKYLEEDVNKSSLSGADKIATSDIPYTKIKKPVSAL